MTLARRPALAVMAALAMTLAVSDSLRAQGTTAPRTVTLVVPYAAGGGSDIVARALAEALRKQTGHVYVVENRAGANGAIALESVSRAPKDGSVALIGNPATQCVLPLLMAKKPRFDPAVPVAAVASAPGVLAAHKDVPARNVAELVAFAKRNPGKVSYASAGNGSMAHLSFLAVAEQADLDLVHIPYKSGPQSFTDNVAGLVHLNFVNVGNALPLIKEGRLKALAVSGTARVEQLPEVPTLLEQGFEGALTPNWQGIFLPPGTPQALVEELAAQVAKAQQTPEFRAQIAAANMNLWSLSSPKAFAAYLDKTTASFKTLITKHNLEFE